MLTTGEIKQTNSFLKDLKEPSHLGIVSGQWVSVKDRLPEYELPVLLYEQSKTGGDGFCLIGWRTKEKKTIRSKIMTDTWEDLGCKYKIYPTHWKPLPPKPIDA
jgi:hypothetical protein